MTYTKRQFGVELEKHILNEKSCAEIAKWAFTIYAQYCLELEKGLDRFIFQLMVMEEGPEFFLSKGELETVVSELVKGRD